MPEPRKVLATVERAIELFRATPGRKGGLVRLDDADDVMVVGDLHGNVPGFRRFLEIAALAANPKRHLVLQELVHGTRMYPDDAGDKSHQLVDVVCALKCQYADRVHLILGNHELSELTDRPIAKGGVALNTLFRQGIETAYGALADAIYAAYLRLFAALPLACRTPNRVLIVHTLPDARDIEAFDPAIFDAETWPAEWMARRGPVYAITWGRDTSPAEVDRFAQIVDADLFVTGHQPCDDGYWRPNDRQLIVDGTDPAAACCIFPAHGPVTIESLAAGVKVLAPEG
jgi:hypothetical protein